jgi:hypothetical protein
MLNPWFFFGLESAKRGLEAQSAFATSLLRMVGGGSPQSLRPIDNGSAAPECQPPTAVAVARRGKVTNPGNGKIIGSKTGASKRAAAASSKRHAKILRPRRKGR